MALLIISGANVDARDRHSATPLHFAAESGQLRVTVALLQAGADANAQDDGQQSPASRAEEAGHATVADTILTSHKILGAFLSKTEMAIRGQRHY